MATLRTSSAVPTDAAIGGITPEKMSFGGGTLLAEAMELLSVRPGGFYVEFDVSRFKKTGQRAFINNGQTFPLGIQLTATVTPIEFSFGYRFGAKSSRVVPYAAGGVGRRVREDRMRRPTPGAG